MILLMSLSVLSYFSAFSSIFWRKDRGWAAGRPSAPSFTLPPAAHKPFGLWVVLRSCLCCIFVSYFFCYFTFTVQLCEDCVPSFQSTVTFRIPDGFAAIRNA